MPVDALSVTLRALSFLALFQAAGAAFFIAIFKLDGTASDLPVRALGRRAALAATGLLLAHYLLEAGRMGGELAAVLDPALQGIVLHSGNSVELAGQLVGLVLMSAGFRSHRSPAPTLAALGGATALASFTFVGHTVSHPQRWLMGAVLLWHLLVVAFWFGALIPLGRIASYERAVTAAQIVGKFSRLATWLVPSLFIAGLTLAIELLPDLAASGTPYGRLLLVKVAGFALLMLFASLNKWRLAPALARGEASATRSFHRSLAAEYLLIAGVLCITAALTTFYSPED